MLFRSFLHVLRNREIVDPLVWPAFARESGIDDFASIREVIARRFRHRSAGEEEQVFPDILLIDGGKGQLNAALEVLRMLGKEPPCLSQSRPCFHM